MGVLLQFTENHSLYQKGELYFGTKYTLSHDRLLQNQIFQSHAYFTEHQVSDFGVDLSSCHSSLKFNEL